MRKLKLQVQLSVDGFIAGANGEMDWLTMNWSQDIMDYVTKITAPVDTILLGRKLAEGFIPHWTEAFANNAEEPGAAKFVNTPKIVFTKTLTTSTWANTTLASGNTIEEINAIKNQPGADIIVYGGGTFVASLLKEKLIDELHLFINPALLGNGMPIFNSITLQQQLKLTGTKVFDCGIVVLTYQPQ